MKGAGSAERPLNIGLLGAITADKSGMLLEGFDFIQFASLFQFADMQFMVVRVGAEVINVNEFVSHSFAPRGRSSFPCPSLKFICQRKRQAGK